MPTTSIGFCFIDFGNAFGCSPIVECFPSFQTLRPCSILYLLGRCAGWLLIGCFHRRMAEGTLHRVIRVGGNGLVAPEPAHHFREDRPALLLAVIADAPRVV